MSEILQPIESIVSGRNELKRMRELLVEADRLYSNYGLVAGDFGEPGKWIGDVRDFLAGR